MAHLLIVDDDTSMRAMVRLVLESEGHDISEAANGALALVEVTRRMPDVILLDLMMPEMDGWRFLEELRSRGLRSQTRVVIISALSDTATLERGNAEGAQAHLVKPFELVALVDAVNDALENPPETLLARQERVGELASLLRQLSED